MWEPESEADALADALDDALPEPARLPRVAVPLLLERTLPELPGRVLIGPTISSDAEALADADALPLLL